jgi:hypothetical protein
VAAPPGIGADKVAITEKEKRHKAWLKRSKACTTCGQRVVNVEKHQERQHSKEKSSE